MEKFEPTPEDFGKAESEVNRRRRLREEEMEILSSGLSHDEILSLGPIHEEINRGAGKKGEEDRINRLRAKRDNIYSKLSPEAQERLANLRLHLEDKW